MAVSLKPLDAQVIVITGASSGIGLATAITAAQQGAAMVLAARSRETLAVVVQQIESAGGQALAVVADVARRADVEEIASQAIARFGRIDTWINNAAVGIYARLDDVGEDDSRRLFDTNFWGVVNGSMTALPHLKANGSGGALINLGSELSEASVPLQGMYAASKYAVKGFTDGLRMELDADKAPVSVTLIQPASVDTPFPDHSANYMSQQPRLPTPLIDVDDVARAILHAAVKPVREVKVGAVAVLDTLMAKFMPGLRDAIAQLQLGRQQRNEAPRTRTGTLYEAGESGRMRGRGAENAANVQQGEHSNLRST